MAAIHISLRFRAYVPPIDLAAMLSLFVAIVIREPRLQLKL